MKLRREFRRLLVGAAGLGAVAFVGFGLKHYKQETGESHRFRAFSDAFDRNFLLILAMRRGLRFLGKDMKLMHGTLTDFVVSKRALDLAWSSREDRDILLAFLESENLSNSTVFARAPSLSDLNALLKLSGHDQILEWRSLDKDARISDIDEFFKEARNTPSVSVVLFFILSHADTFIRAGKARDVQNLIQTMEVHELRNNASQFVRVIDAFFWDLDPVVIVPLLLRVLSDSNKAEIVPLILRLIRRDLNRPEVDVSQFIEKIYLDETQMELLKELIRCNQQPLSEEIEQTLLEWYFKKPTREILACLSVRPNKHTLSNMVPLLESELGVSDYEVLEKQKSMDSQWNRPIFDSELYAFHDESPVSIPINSPADERSLFARISILSDILRHKLGRKEFSPEQDLSKCACVLLEMASKQLVELIPDLADEISARNAMRALANISTLGRYVQVDVRDRFLEYCKNFIEKAPESNSIHTRAEVDRLAHNIRCLPIKSAPMLIDSFLPLSGSTPADSEVDFVFIHGLRGGLKTWRVLNRPGDTEIKLWPSLCLSDCFPAVRLLAFTYEAPLWYATHKQHYSEVDVKRNFDEMALSLRSALSDAGVGRNGKKVVFITFSMGGLVAKRALVDDEQLRNNTLGVVFFATPHLGSPIADYAYYTSVGGLLVSPFVEDLSRKSKQVLSLHEAYQDTCQQIPSLSVCETAQADIGAGIKAMVVPYESCSACSENAMSSAMVAGNNVDHEAVPKIPADLVCHDHRVVALMEFLNRIIARHQHNHN